jgi:protoheme IX farnesyltransferase
MINTKKINGYIELTKPRILTLVLVTTTLGYYMGGKGFHNIFQLFFLLLGAGTVCGGSAVLNHYLEREFDSKMLRTKNRPLPSGLITPSNALAFGVILTLIGLFVLYTKINILTAFLSLLTSFLYIMVYTPMKRTSWLNTTVGAIPGAIPPLGGWAAATGTLNFDAGILFLIIFIWQHPHFYAIAWMFKDDYSRGGFKMLPCVEPDGKRMFDHIIKYCILLIPISIIPTFTGLSGPFYAIGATIAGLLLLKVGYKFFQTKSISDAKNLLKATVVYLPAILLLIIVDAKF